MMGWAGRMDTTFHDLPCTVRRLAQTPGVLLGTSQSETTTPVNRLQRGAQFSCARARAWHLVP